jgi:protein-L-isoaspartate(D-aspartate) O-methyltransferase
MVCCCPKITPDPLPRSHLPWGWSRTVHSAYNKRSGIVRTWCQRIDTMAVWSPTRVLDSMNGIGRSRLRQLVLRSPPPNLGGLFAIGMLIVLFSVLGMVAWFGREDAAPPDRRERSPDDPMQTTLVAQADGEVAGSSEEEVRFRKARRDMVEHHFRRRDITDQRVLEVMERIPRHLYVPENLQDSAYADRPLPIGRGQTISQPYIVALMTQLANPQADSRALDVGTGSGYQAAVLGELCKEVYSIEIVEDLAQQAADRLARLGYQNVHVRAGDGYQGWPEHAPFDLIIVAAAPAHVPQPLIEQLAPGGRMIIPVGRFQQDLMVIEKLQDGTVRQWSEIPVAFVPMTGEAQQAKQERD